MTKSCENYFLLLTDLNHNKCKQFGILLLNNNKNLPLGSYAVSPVQPSGIDGSTYPSSSYTLSCLLWLHALYAHGYNEQC